MLAECGPPVNRLQHGGWTTLHAAHNGDKETIQILLQHGADALAQNDAGKRPAEIAECKGYADGLTLLSAA